MDDDDGPDLPMLVTEARQGRQDAWDCIVRRFAPLVVAVTRQCGLPTHDAQDVMQTVWLRLVEHLEELREPRALPGWIKVTTRHESLRQASRPHRVGPVDALVIGELLVEQSGPQPDFDLLAAERHTLLLEAFAELPENQRRLLELLTVDPPLSYTEISARLGIPIGSIGPTRRRALDRLRRNPILTAMSERSQFEEAGG
ncbi:MAG TPA: sigma-70 family RNA polymerase sigma factor [Nakamurella sp.]|jgi:RNA polymerase sigma factor (sigma-70 family)